MISAFPLAKKTNGENEVSWHVLSRFQKFHPFSKNDNREQSIRLWYFGFLKRILAVVFSRKIHEKYTMAFFNGE